MSNEVRWEVWVSARRRYAIDCDWRFNACFSTLQRADQESLWYRARGYAVEVRTGEA